MKKILLYIVALCGIGLAASAQPYNVIGSTNPAAINWIRGSLQVDSNIYLKALAQSDSNKVISVRPDGKLYLVTKSNGATIDTTRFQHNSDTSIWDATKANINSAISAITLASVVANGNTVTNNTISVTDGGNFRVNLLYTGISGLYSNSNRWNLSGNSTSGSLLLYYNSNKITVSPDVLSTDRQVFFRDKGGYFALTNDSAIFASVAALNGKASLGDTANNLRVGGNSPSTALNYGTLTSQPLVTYVAGMPRDSIAISGADFKRANVSGSSGSVFINHRNDTSNASGTANVMVDRLLFTDLGTNSGLHLMVDYIKRGGVDSFTIDTGANIHAHNIMYANDTVSGAGTKNLVTLSRLNTSTSALVKYADTVGGSGTVPVFYTAADVNANLAKLATANTFTAAQTISIAGTGNTVFNGLILSDGLATSLSTQNYSPALSFNSQAWNTTNSKSDSNVFRVVATPVTGASTSAQLRIKFFQNTGTESDVMTLTNAGAMTIPGNFTATGTVNGTNGATFSNPVTITMTGSSLTSSFTVNKSSASAAGAVAKFQKQGANLDTIGVDGGITEVGTGTNYLGGNLVIKSSTDDGTNALQVTGSVKITSLPSGANTDAVTVYNAANSQLRQVTTATLFSGATWTVNTATDANYTVTGAGQFIKLPTITAGRNVVLPTGTTGATLILVNLNTSGNAWTPTNGTIKDLGNNTVATLVNGNSYRLIYDGTNWQMY